MEIVTDTLKWTVFALGAVVLFYLAIRIGFTAYFNAKIDFIRDIGDIHLTTHKNGRGE